MARWVKRLAAVLLVPLCLGSTEALLRILSRGGDLTTVWPLLAGVGCWLVIFLLLPKPIRLYVLGHELTHALWTWLFLGRVKGFKVSARGGYVMVTKVNFLITLAPYFFPLYALAVALVYAVGCRTWHWEPYRALFLVVLGAAYAFHVTLTWHALRTPQSDLASEGHAFSVMIIWLGNVTVLWLGLAILLGIPLRQPAVDALGGTVAVCRAIARTVATAWR